MAVGGSIAAIKTGEVIDDRREDELKAIERSRVLRSLVKSEIFPLLEERGFQPLKHSGIFYGFTRIQSDQLQLFEIQWDKYHRPRFAINFSRVALVMNDGEAGFRNRFTDEWLPLAELHGGHGEYSFLCFGRFGRRWFRYSWLSSLRPSAGPQIAIERAIAFLPLIDGWFAGDPSSTAIVDRMNQRKPGTTG